MLFETKRESVKFSPDDSNYFDEFLGIFNMLIANTLAKKEEKLYMNKTVGQVAIDDMMFNTEFLYFVNFTIDLLEKTSIDVSGFTQDDVREITLRPIDENFLERLVKHLCTIDATTLVSAVKKEQKSKEEQIIEESVKLFIIKTIGASLQLLSSIPDEALFEDIINQEESLKKIFNRLYFLACDMAKGKTVSEEDELREVSVDDNLYQKVLFDIGILSKAKIIELSQYLD